VLHQLELLDEQDRKDTPVLQEEQVLKDELVLKEVQDLKVL
jgi:hypothetical protein